MVRMHGGLRISAITLKKFFFSTIITDIRSCSSATASLAWVLWCRNQPFDPAPAPPVPPEPGKGKYAIALLARNANFQAVPLSFATSYF